MKTLRIRPAEGRVVRDPDLHDLITAPRTVRDTPFWRRRLRDGDVTQDDAAPSSPESLTSAEGLSAHEPDTPALQGRIPSARSTSAKRTNDEGDTR